jgi:hypothetical protein
LGVRASWLGHCSGYSARYRDATEDLPVDNGGYFLFRHRWKVLASSVIFVTAVSLCLLAVSLTATSIFFGAYGYRRSGWTGGAIFQL